MSTVQPPRQVTNLEGRVLVSPALLRAGQHVVTAMLLVIVVLRALSDGSGLAPILVAAVGFAGWYVAGFIAMARAHSQRLPLWWLAILVLLWVAGLWASPEFIWLAFSLWLLLGHQLPLLPSALWSAVVYALVVLAPYLHRGHSDVAAMAGPLVGGLFAWGISRGYLQLEHDAKVRSDLVDSLLRAQQEMTELQEELARSQHAAGIAKERTRLAREIHDTVAQQLSSIGLHAKAALTAADAEKTRTALQRIDELSGESLNDLRRIIAALAPAELDAQALTGALERILANYARDAGLTTRLHVDPGLPIMDPSIQIALLRTAQSALSNVRRHARASTVALSLEFNDHEVRMDIVDDGVGFNAQSALDAPVSDAGGYGLTAMTRRLKELGGDLEVESAPGDGTALCAHVPLRMAKED
ncbi:sensor histidine kinase [Glutamicibacter endophyticus]